MGKVTSGCGGAKERELAPCQNKYYWHAFGVVTVKPEMGAESKWVPFKYKQCDPPILIKCEKNSE